MQSTSIAELAANIAGEPWGKGSLAHLSRDPCRRIYLWPAMDADRLYRRQSFDIFNFIMGTLCVLNCLPLGSVRAILKDGRDKAVEAGCVIAGGHTIQDDEPRYCLCVTGFVHPRHILKNVGTR